MGTKDYRYTEESHEKTTLFSHYIPMDRNRLYHPKVPWR
jgi:hypothetical protein